MKKNNKSKKSYNRKKEFYDSNKNENYRRGKNRKPTEDRDEDFNAHKSRPNDIRWYAMNEQLLKDTASIPYSWPLGNKLNLGPYATYVNKGSLPGIFSIHTAPTFGWSDNENSPINVAARNVYSFVRHANAGHTNYDAVDLMIYLMAMDSCYSFMSYARRIYGIMQLYSFTNRYYPVALVKAMGVNFYDIQRNLNDFRAWINNLAVKFGSMCIPASMSYMAKHMWMYEGIYTDTPQDKAQIYAFVPDGFYQFDLVDNSGALVYKRLMKMNTTFQAESVPDDSDNLLTFAELRDYGNALIDPILKSEDMNIMSGDILKAYKPENLYMMNSITEDYTVLPTYSEEVLDQIQNCTMIGRFTNDHAELKQDETKGWLVYTPTFHFPYQFASVTAQSAGENFLFASKFINFDHGDITPGMTMEASRMTQVCHDQDEENLAWTYHTLASEVAMYGYVYYFAEQDGVWQLMRSRTVHTANTAIVDPSTTQGGISIPLTITSGIGTSNQGVAPIAVPQINPMTVLQTFNPVLLLA